MCIVSETKNTPEISRTYPGNENQNKNQNETKTIQCHICDGKYNNASFVS